MPVASTSPMPRNNAFLPTGPTLSPRAAFAAKKAAYLAAKEPVTFEKTITKKPLSKTAAKFFGSVANAFSTVGAKATMKYGSVFAAGVAVGAIICAFAAPHLPALIASMTASAAFPPVMIAIGVTAGVALLAFGIYKFVKMSKAKTALNTEVLAAKAKLNMPVPYEAPAAPQAYEPAPVPAPQPDYTPEPVPSRRTPPPINDEANAWNQ